MNVCSFVCRARYAAKTAVGVRPIICLPLVRSKEKKTELNQFIRVRIETRKLLMSVLLWKRLDTTYFKWSLLICQLFQRKRRNEKIKQILYSLLFLVQLLCIDLGLSAWLVIVQIPIRLLVWAVSFTISNGFMIKERKI